MSGLRINFCSGQRPFDKPWINVDSQPKWNPDLVADAKFTGYVNDCAEMIVIHQGLEHFWAEDAKAVIRECYRILQPGGSLIVTVPNMRALALKWLRGEMDTALYMINVYGAFMGDQADLHRWGYTPLTLAFLLSECGAWTQYKTFDNREIPGASIAADWWILEIEAVK